MEIEEMKRDDAYIPDTLSSYEELVDFIRHEMAALGRLDLISFILGEFENNGCVFPLSKYSQEYKKFLLFSREFITYAKQKRKGKTSGIEDIERSGLLKLLSNYVWYGKNEYVKRKRSYKEKKAQLYNFTTDGKCNCLCLALALISVVRNLGIRNIYILLSEVHVWIGYFDHTDPVVPIKDVKDDPSKLLSSEIMTPDGEVGLPIQESLLHSWSYLIPNKSSKKNTVLNDGTCAFVADNSELLAALISNLDFEDEQCEWKVRLSTSLWSESNASSTSYALVEIGDSLVELKRYLPAIHHYLQAHYIGLKKHAGLLVYPMASLGDCYVEMKKWYLALQSYAASLAALTNFDFTRWDYDLLKEISNDIISPLQKEGIKMLLKDLESETEDKKMKNGEMLCDLVPLEDDLYNSTSRLVPFPELCTMPWSNVNIRDRNVPSHSDVLKLLLFLYDKLFYWFEVSGRASSTPIGWMNAIPQMIGQFQFDDRMRMLEYTNLESGEMQSSLIKDVLPLLCLEQTLMRRELAQLIVQYVEVSSTESSGRRRKRRN